MKNNSSNMLFLTFMLIGIMISVPQMIGWVVQWGLKLI